jgi:putative ABC transport system substrate-binding protein
MAGGARAKPLSRIAGEGGSPDRVRRVSVVAPGQPIAPSRQPSPPMAARGLLGATRRRTILAGVAATLMPQALPAPARARSGMRRLGVLMSRRADDPEGQAYAAALVEGLRVLNWKEGGNLRIVWRWAGSDPALFERYAAELVALGPEVVLAFSSPSVEALRRQTSTIPVVFTVVSDPVGQGFVASLAHPGGTITGFSIYDPPMIGKWLQMLTQITPPVARVAILYNPATAPYAGLYLRAIQDTAPSLAVVARAAPVNGDAEIEALIAGLANEERGGLLVLTDPYTSMHREAIVALAARYRLPAVYPYRFFAAAGGLMSYGVDIADLFRRAAAYVDRILRGAAPGDLPVQNPTKFELAINLKTAKALGVTIPPSLLAAADEVIE